MNTKAWGPSFWETLHFVSFGYPTNPDKNKQMEYKQFYVSIANVLPCIYCRQSYSKFLRILPIDNYLNSRDHLTLWVYLVHCLVNQKLGIRNNPSFNSVKNKYEQYRAK